MNIKKVITLTLLVILCSLRAEAAGYYKCTDSKGAVSFGPHACAEGQNQNVIEIKPDDNEESRLEQARIVNERRSSGIDPLAAAMYPTPNNVALPDFVG